MVSEESSDECYLLPADGDTLSDAFPLDADTSTIIPKGTKLWMEQRLLEIQKMLLSGVSREEVYTYGEKNWNVSEKSMKRMIRAVYGRFSQLSSVEWKEARGQVIAQSYDLYQKSYDAKDYRTCLEILKHLSKIIRLDDPQLSNSQTKNVIIISGQKDDFD